MNDFDKMRKILNESGWVEGIHFIVWYEIKEICICISDDDIYFEHDENGNLIKITLDK